MKINASILGATSMLASVAVVGMLTGCLQAANGSSNMMGNGAGTQAMTMAWGLHHCRGQNACKGQGGCKTSAHSCVGKNSCKGQGGCATIAPKKSM